MTSKIKSKMKKSKKPTPYILVQAFTNSIRNRVDFAIIHLSEIYKITLQQRLRYLEHFKAENSFLNLTYWDSPSGYYTNSTGNQLSAQLLKNGTCWTYITLTADEVAVYIQPENPLDAHQFLLMADGNAYFKAFGKYAGEEFWTKKFNLKTLINL